jgi:DNA repair exonuclease SbcCD ATPase subunit
VPEPSNQTSLHRRANWVGLRTLRQRPKLTDATTADGDVIYEIRSTRLVLRGLSPHFDRLAPCARCGKELPAAPVLTVADLDRPLRAVICSDCVKGTGVSTVWDQPAGRPAEAGGEVAEPEVAVAEVATPAPAPAEAPAEPEPPQSEPQDGRRDVFERHLRAVTERVNELGKALWALGQERDERRREDEAARSALAGVGDQISAQRSELADVVSAVTELRSELHRLSDASRDLVSAHQKLEQRLADASAGAEAQAAELSPVVAAHEALERRVAEMEARPPQEVPPSLGSDLERIVARRLAELEAGVTEQMAGRWRGVEEAIEASVRASSEGFRRAHEELATNQAGAVERLDALAAQVAHVSSRMDALASWAATTNDRLDSLEERTERALLAGAPRLEVPVWEAPEEPSGASRSLLETLDRQLQDAASRLAARAHGGPDEEPGRGF